MNKYEDMPCGDDLKRIVICLSKEGYFINPYQAKIIWEEYSSDMCASWKMLPADDGELIAIVKNYFGSI